MYAQLSSELAFKATVFEGDEEDLQGVVFVLLALQTYLAGEGNAQLRLPTGTSAVSLITASLMIRWRQGQQVLLMLVVAQNNTTTPPLLSVFLTISLSLSLCLLWNDTTVTMSVQLYVRFA